MGGWRLETPGVEAEWEGIVQGVSEHGGYAFVRLMAASACSGSGEEGDMRAAEAAREMAWEQLHSGPWHSVLPLWRDAFSLSSLRVASLHLSRGHLSEALRILDMALIMGGPLLRPDLHSAVSQLSSFSNANSSAAPPASSHLPRPIHITHAQMLKILPQNSLSSKAVEKNSGLSFEGFLQHYFIPGLPVVISNSMSHWPAITKWSDFEYLKSVAGDRTVPVEVGKNYLCPEWKQELITFSQFLERLRATDSSPAGPTYLAQHPLFDQIDDLKKDICIPDYCFAGGGELRSINAWFGPAGTVTPLHHDPHHNILAQVVGRKYVRLYPASLTNELYPYDETMLCNSSQVDLDNINKETHPKIQDLEFMDCILEEGEMMYIPPKWWHYVRSLTPSLSVSFWWNDIENSTEP